MEVSSLVFLLRGQGGHQFFQGFEAEGEAGEEPLQDGYHLGKYQLWRIDLEEPVGLKASGVLLRRCLRWATQT